MNCLNSIFHDRNDIEFYSLQMGDGSDDAKKYPNLIDLTSEIKTYDDTLAFLENLDYVVTSCTSVLHASAIVGTKTLGLIPISAYFTWVSPATPGRDSNTSIWYDDNLRLFKQTIPKDWTLPFEEIKGYFKNENINNRS